MTHKHAIILSLLLLPAITMTRADESATASHPEPSSPALPAPSVVVDLQFLTTDMEGNPDDGKLRLDHVELGLQGYLHPRLYGDLVVAFEQEYLADDSVESEVDVEEAYIMLLDIPGGLEAMAGRAFVGFGRLNAVHSHHWSFVDTPLAFANLFGDHAWYDDGGALRWSVPNTGDLGIKLSASAWNGRSLHHSHTAGEEHEEDHAEHEEHEEDAHDPDATIEWDGAVGSGRAFLDLPATDRLGLQAGYSIAGDEGGSLLQGLDLVVNYYWPGVDCRLKWHTEAFHFDDDTRGTSPVGLFSTVSVAPTPYWELGGRYDWTEMLADDTEETWAGSGFVTYYITHATYARAQYQYREHADGEVENLVMAQLVWGLGPHSDTCAAAPLSPAPQDGGSHAHTTCGTACGAAHAH